MFVILYVRANREGNSFEVVDFFETEDAAKEQLYNKYKPKLKGSSNHCNKCWHSEKYRIMTKNDSFSMEHSYSDDDFYIDDDMECNNEHLPEPKEKSEEEED